LIFERVKDSFNYDERAALAQMNGKNPTLASQIQTAIFDLRRFMLAASQRMTNGNDKKSIED